jgi:molecular chaperone GrpE (heat shock protein)
MDKVIQKAKSTVTTFSQGLFKQTEQHNKFVQNEALNSNNPKSEEQSKKDELKTCFDDDNIKDQLARTKAELDEALKERDREYSFSRDSRCEIF